MGRLGAMARLAWTDPRELSDRVRMTLAARWSSKIDMRGSYAPIPVLRIPEMMRSVGIDAPSFSDAPGLDEIEQYVRSLADEENLYGRRHNMDLALARLAYMLTRALRPQVIVETGVAFGVSTAFLLQALEQNGQGVVHSIDLPPLVDVEGRFTGRAVPEALRDRWTLHRGSAARVLPEVLKSVGKVDMFVHDSLHTRRHMAWEFETVSAYLSPGSVLLADDVDKNTAFGDWLASVPTRLSLTLSEPDKARIAGIGVL